MVNNRCNNRGLIDWIIQRVSAVLIGIYSIFIIIFLLTHSPLYYPVWKNLFSYTAMKIATFIVLIAILWHAWIGLWTVLTDYVKNNSVRLFLQIVIVVLLAAYFVWCLFTLVM